jgi:hypothetical protein
LEEQVKTVSGVLTLVLILSPGIASSATMKCKVSDYFQLSDSGRLEAVKHLAHVLEDVFYVDTRSGKITGGPMSSDGWGEIKVYPVVYPGGNRDSLTIVSFTHGTDTARGLRTMYVSWKRKNEKYPFQISDGPFIYSGTCDAPLGGL